MGHKAARLQQLVRVARLAVQPAAVTAAADYEGRAAGLDAAPRLPAGRGGNRGGKAGVAGTAWGGTLPSVATGDKVTVRANVKGYAMAVSDAKTATAS